MSISCKCSTRNKGLEPLSYQIEVKISKFPPAQKLLLESGEFEWMPVIHFERMLGLRRQAVKDLISSGALVAFEIPQNPTTKLGYGRRAFVAVQSFPCNTCCPDHYKLKWEEHVRVGKSER